MPQIINTNIASINAQRNLNTSQADNQTALSRLSSGLRINSAKDDAAGLAISTRFTSQVRGLNVAIRNSGDGVSLAQTAEGALGAMTEGLLRIRDLALQSANATNSAIDREALNQEVQQLKEEIKRISDQTNFNGTKLLDGTFSDVTFQIGANEGESVTFGIEGATVDQLGAANTDGISSDQQGGITQTITPMVAGDLVINGIAIGASSGVDDAFSNVEQEKSAIAKVVAINRLQDQTGIKAVVNNTTVSGSATFNAGAATGDITINGVTITIAADAGLSDEANLESIVNVINESSGQTGVTAEFNGNAASGISLSAADGRNIEILNDTVTATNAGLAAATTYSGSFTLISADGTSIALDSTTGNIGNAGLAVGEFSGSNSGAVSQAVNDQPFLTGDLVINGIPVGPTLASFDTASSAQRDSSAIAKAEAINRVADDSGVTAIVNATALNAGTITQGADGSGSIDVNGVTVNIAYSAADTVADKQNTIITAINNKAGQTGVRAEALGDSYRLLADDGRNIFVDGITLASGTFDQASLGLVDSLGADLDLTQPTQSSLTLQSAGSIELDSITGNIENAGFEIGIYGSNETGQLVQDISITTVDGALAALDSVDNALNSINLQRANLGAIQNRFESTISNQAIAVENLQAANSRIKDADFAAETAELSRSQVLQQAGLSILAQANGQPQQVLQLLQG